jgi:hypothetical protein
MTSWSKCKKIRGGKMKDASTCVPYPGLSNLATPIPILNLKDASINAHFLRLPRRLVAPTVDEGTESSPEKITIFSDPPKGSLICV